MRGFISGASQSIAIAALDVRESFGRHFDYFHEGWKPRGLYLRLPVVGTELWIEWRKVNVGFGMERPSRGEREFFCGRLQGAISFTRGGL